MPHRRTFAAGLQPFRFLGGVCAPAGTDPPQADWSLPPLAAYAGSRGTGDPSLAPIRLQEAPGGSLGTPGTKITPSSMPDDGM